MDEITLPENQSTKLCCFQTETHQEFLQLYARCLVILLAFDPGVLFLLAFSTKMCTGLSRDQLDVYTFGGQEVIRHDKKQDGVSSGLQ